MRILALLFALGAFAADRDVDGVADELEQSLLERFVPTFYMAKNDCAVAPAEFE